MALILLDKAPDASASVNAKYERRSKQVALGYFDIEDTPTFVLRNCGLRPGASLTEDLGQYLLDFDVDLESTFVPSPVDGVSPCNLWRITANYGPWDFATKGDPAQFGNPLTMPIRPRIEYESHPEPIFEDINGNPILNSAGDPFDPTVEVSNDIAVITIERNEAATLNIASIMALRNKINTNPWNGFDSKCVMFCSNDFPALQYDQESNIYYYPMVYVFKVKFDNWQAKPLNAGFNQLSPTQINQNRVIPILDDSGQPLTNPGLLNLQGQWQKPPVPSDQVLYAVFDVMQDIDFSVFNLDSIFTPSFLLS